MDGIVKLMQQGLDGASARQEAIANNIANVDTPNYKRKDLDFTSTMQQAQQGRESLALRRTHRGHISGLRRDEVESKPFREDSSSRFSYRSDGNNVDIDREMAELSKNELYYNTISRQLGRRFGMYQSVIDRGGR